MFNRAAIRMATLVVLVFGVMLVVPSAQAPADPISGTWVSDGRPFLELQANADAVAGTVHFYGGATRVSAPIDTGSFDARAGALRLTGRVAALDGGSASYVIDGVLEQDMLRVTLTIDDGRQGSEVLRRLEASLAAQAGSTGRRGTVLITGANRGLGLEFARQYAAAGWTVIATARNPTAANDLRDLAATRSNVTIEQLDVLDRAAIAALAGKYRGRPIDVLLNNAGVLGDLKLQMLGSLDYDEFEEVMAVNVYAPLAMAEAFLEHVAASEQKKVVSITSRSGVISQPGWRGPYFYRASKIGLNMVMRVLADDVRERNVIVALVSPPPTETDMLRALIGPEGAAQQAKPDAVVASLITVIGGLSQSSQAVTYVDGTALPW